MPYDDQDKEAFVIAGRVFQTADIEMVIETGQVTTLDELLAVLKNTNTFMREKLKSSDALKQRHDSVKGRDNVLVAAQRHLYLANYNPGKVKPH